MPSGVAVGLAEGSNDFITNFRQARLLKHQQKMLENEPILRAMQSILGDDMTPYSVKADILDHIGNLVTDNKIKVPLSEQTGLRRLLKEKIITDEGQTEIKPKAAIVGTPSKNLTAAETSTPNAGQVLPTRPTQSTQAVPGRDYIAPTSVNRGDISPLEYKTMLQEKLATKKEEEQYTRQVGLINANIDAQTRSLKATGFTKEIFRGFDENNNYKVVMANASGETKTINLGKQDPEKVRIAQVRGNGTPSRALTNQTQYYLYGNDPSTGDRPINPQTGQYYTQAEAYSEALGDVSKAFNLTNEARQAFIQGATQRNTGTTPIQPAQKADDERANQQNLLQLQTTADTIEAQAIEASANSATATQARTAYWDSTVQPIKDRITELQNNDPDNYKESVEFKQQQSALQRAMVEYNNLDKVANIAVGKDNSLKKKLEDVQKRMKKFGTKNGKYPIAVMNIIEQVRQGKNKDKVVGMSDDDIYAQLVNAGKITQ